MANSVCWYGHLLRKALEFEVKGQRAVKEDMEKAG